MKPKQTATAKATATSTAINCAQVLAYVSTLSKQTDLADLRLINEAVAAQWKTIQYAAADTFEVGDKVEFEISGKRKYSQNGIWAGKIVAFKKRGRAFLVLAARKDSPFRDEQRWVIAATMLKKAGR